MCDKSWCVLAIKSHREHLFFLLTYEMERGHVFKPYLGHWSYLAMFQEGCEAVNHYHLESLLLEEDFLFCSYL